MDAENQVDGKLKILAIFRMDDNSLRLIRGQWDWSGTPAFDSMTEYQMRHVIYPDTPIISTPVKIRASIGDSGEGLVEPWLNFYIISFN